MLFIYSTFTLNLLESAPSKIL